MYVLGYSGLDGYVDFKSKKIYNLSNRENSVGQGMDAAAVIMKDGKIIAAAAEERFTKQKHAGRFPVNAIKYCLEEANVQISEIDIIAHNFDYMELEDMYYMNKYSTELFNTVLSNESQIKLFRNYFNVDIKDKFKAYIHHDCHAAYAFDTSGFSSSLVFVVDGLGEVDSISIYCANKNTGFDKIAAYGPDSSLGMLYAAITDYLGYYTNSDEYKVMGLAAFGDPSAYKEIMDEIITVDDGLVKINHLFPDIIKTPEDRETYRFFKSWLSTRIFPERQQDDSIEQKHKDLAAALQHKLNEVMTSIAIYWQKRTGQKNLCMAGGVALNCVANEKIANLKIFDGFYVAPASADDGTALGACLLSIRNCGLRLEDRFVLDMPFYGPYIDLPIHNLDKVSISLMSDTELVSRIADEIINGEKIVAWSMGRMEFGPRALGHRSILANPRNAEMRERLNTVTKQRESYRPFAPIVKSESLKKVFCPFEGAVYKHMLINVDVRPEYRNRLQAATHVDGTARVQSVEKKDLPLLWKLLDKVGMMTGVPVILNTSFNLKSMPIVCTGDDAIFSFLNSDIDLLVINNYLLEKK